MRYSTEQRAFLKDYISGHHFKEIVEEFNKRFPERQITVSTIKSYCGYHNIKTGVRSNFAKGHVPHNKGKKQIDYMTATAIEKTKATRFQKGHDNIRQRPVGSERITKDGYIEIKVAEPNKWRLKQQVEWEKYHGPIPKGHVVIFLDGNILNTQIDNLALISRATLLRLNRRGWKAEYPEILKAYINILNLEDQTRESEGDKK